MKTDMDKANCSSYKHC